MSLERENLEESVCFVKQTLRFYPQYVVHLVFEGRVHPGAISPLRLVHP